MNRRPPNGDWCLWRANLAGSCNGKVVLAELRDIADPEHGGSYTVNVYESEKSQGEGGGWEHEVVRLKPDSDRGGFEAMEVRGGEMRVVAERVRSLGCG